MEKSIKLYVADGNFAEAGIAFDVDDLKSVVKGKRVILVDDSIVRGTTCKRIVNLLREAGAKEVHMRISCPPFTNPCYFGVDIDSRENLIACQMTIPEICSYIGADSLGYLSLKGVKSLTSPDLQEEDWFCTGCFADKNMLETMEKCMSVLDTYKSLCEDNL